MSKTSYASAMHDLIRHLDDAARLRENALVARCLGASATRDPQRLPWIVRQIVEKCCAALPSRQRAIIIRCDLGGELHRSVASALGISVRHFYRERRKAIDALANLLANTARITELEAPREPDPYSLHESHVDALQHAGRFDEAIAALDSLRVNAGGTFAFVRITCRLVHLCCEAGLTSQAEEHLIAAQSTLAALSECDEVHALECELELTKAQQAWHLGALDAAEAHAQRAGQMARRLGRLWWPRRHDECVGAALLMQSAIRHTRGDFSSALNYAVEARELLSHSAMIRPALRLRSLNAVALARLFLPGALSRSLEEFGNAYDLASSHSLPRESAAIASTIGAIHIWRGELQRAESLCRAALVTSRTICSDYEQSAIALDLAASYVLRGDVRSTRLVLQHNEKQLQCSALTRGLSRLVAADACISEGRFDAALGMARDGYQMLCKLPGGRFLGSALRVQADALEGLGERAAARARIQESLELLSTSGHPFTLLRSYRSSARINRDRGHFATAKQIMSQLSQ